MADVFSDPRNMSRRRLLGIGLAGAAGGALAVGLPATQLLKSHAAAPDSTQVGLIYQLQAAFHRAKTSQDIDLMMSLWADDAGLTVQGDAKSPYRGHDALRTFWLGSGSFNNRRLSLVPSFKTQIRVTGSTAWLYFECHDVGDYDLATRSIVGDTFLAGILQLHAGAWQFQNMTAGKSSPLSFDHYYFP
jgi:ketosteroid isomerase-like protein